MRRRWGARDCAEALWRSGGFLRNFTRDSQIFADRAIVHSIIYDELVQGVIRDASRAEYRRIIAGLIADGAEAIVLGCTEIMLLVGEEDSAVPLFDTLGLHVDAAVEAAMAS